MIQQTSPLNPVVGNGNAATPNSFEEGKASEVEDGHYLHNKLALRKQQSLTPHYPMTERFGATSVVTCQPQVNSLFEAVVCFFHFLHQYEIHGL